MNLALSKKQLVLLALIIVALLITISIVIHASVPSFWHTITGVTDDILNRRP